MSHALLLASLSLLLPACASDSSSDRALDDFRRDAEGVVRNSPAGDPASQSAPAKPWTIILATFSGDDAPQRAAEILQRITTETRLTGARIENRPEGAAITFGDYDGPSSPRARQELQTIRSIQVGGRPAFPLAFLAPRSNSAAIGAVPEINLLRAREIYGSDALYTLQVAVYESDNRNEAMRKAEEAALKYRRDGETAFYYHGPSRSMVTIGVFGADDIDLDTGLVSPELQALQERHPYNLYNGAGLRESSLDGRSNLQRSALVQIPSS